MPNTRLKELREEKKLSREQLGELLGVSKWTIRSWELDASEYTLLTAVRISRVLKCSLDELAGIEPKTGSVEHAFAQLTDENKAKATGYINGLKDAQ